MKKSMMIMTVLAMLLALSVPFVSALAQDQKPRDEAAVYKDWYEANAAKDVLKAWPFANEYLEKFPAGNYAAYLKKWKVQARAVLFNQARQAKNMAEEIRIGKEALAEEPENLDYLYLMVIDLRANEMEASPANYSHAADAADFAQRAAKLVEAGKPANVFKPEAAKAVLAYLYQTSAMIEGKNSNQDKAIELYKKSSATDPATGILNAQNYLALGVIYQMKYGAAAKKYEGVPEAEKTSEPPSANAKAALDDVQAMADAVIEAWAHFLAIPDSTKYGPTRANVEKALTDLWKFRHDDKTDGLQEYINKFKSAAASSTTPASGDAAAATKG
jgi:hypothetical protein